MHENVDTVLVWREQRTVTAALTLHYNKVVFILEPTDVSRDLARKRVTVCEYPDGRVEIWHDGPALPYRTFDKLRRVNQAAIVDNKLLGAAPTAAREMQALRAPGTRNNDAPTRRAQPAPMFPEPAADPVLPPARSEIACPRRSSWPRRSRRRHRRSSLAVATLEQPVNHCRLKPV